MPLPLNYPPHLVNSTMDCHGVLEHGLSICANVCTRLYFVSNHQDTQKQTFIKKKKHDFVCTVLMHSSTHVCNCPKAVE